MSSLNELIKERRNYHGRFKEYWAAELEGECGPGLATFEDGTVALESLYALLRTFSDGGVTPASTSGISSLMKPCDG